MKLTTMSNEVLNFVKDNGGRIDIEEIITALDRSARSIGANVTDLKNKGLAVREKETVGEGENAHTVTYVALTHEGMTFVPEEDEDED